MKKQTVTVTLSALLSLCLAFCAGCAKNGKTAAISSKAVQSSESSSAVENSLESTAASRSAEVITSSLTAEDAAKITDIAIGQTGFEYSAVKIIELASEKSQ